MTRKAIKMNINQFISLCVKTNSAWQLFTPHGQTLAVVYGLSFERLLEHYPNNGEVNYDTKGHEQLKDGVIIIITL